MLYWYPKIKALAIPQPKTIIVKVDPETACKVIDGEGFYAEAGKFMAAVKELGIPVFIRTDHLSGKHSWKRTCFLNSRHYLDLIRHIYRLTDETLGCDVIGKPVNAFIFREYIPMDSKYTAFWGEMPVSPERRYFVEDGQVLCHHAYWIEEVIARPSVENWRELSREMNEQTRYEIELLKGYAAQVSAAVQGFWSVDFCRARDGRWILIDMAMGEPSWHPEDCPVNKARAEER